jgi:hypothetical protein
LSSTCTLNIEQKETRTVIPKIPNWPYTAWGLFAETSGKQTLPNKRHGQSGKIIKYSRGMGCYLAPTTDGGQRW